jgi:hypothetical protein
MEISCLNCKTKYAGKFCPQCGQESDIARFRFRTIVHDAPQLLDMDGPKIIYTFTQMLVRPGKAAKEFLAGCRVRYFPPFSYLVVLCAINTFVAYYFFDGIDDVQMEYMLFPKAVEFFRKNIALVYALMIPLISFWTWFFNSRQAYNYWENIILNTLLIAQLNIILVVYRLFSVLTGVRFKNANVLLLILFAYLGFAYWQFFGRIVHANPMGRRILMYIMVFLTVIGCLIVTGFMKTFWMR